MNEDTPWPRSHTSPRRWFVDRKDLTFTVHVLTGDGYRTTSHGVGEPAASTLLAPLTTLADVLP